jgi:chromate transporter
MIFIQLFGVFARIGAVTFGGGYAMVSLIERELSDRGWLSAAEFADIVAVSQMTPGPLALNIATYVGRQIAGIPGALSASLGLAAPAFIITAAALLVVKKSRSFRWARAAVRGIQGAVLGLIGTSVLFFLEASVLQGLPDGPVWSEQAGPLVFSPAAAVIFVLALVAAHRFKQGPIRVILGAAVLGVLAFLPGWI